MRLGHPVALPIKIDADIGDHDNEFNLWAELQKSLVSKSKNGKQMIAKESDHMIPWHQPDIIIEQFAKK